MVVATIESPETPSRRLAAAGPASFNVGFILASAFTLTAFSAFGAADFQAPRPNGWRHGGDISPH
jgi:hypothetical protein